MRSRQAITEFLFIRDAPREVDWVMVLGAQTPTNMDPAIALFRAGLARRMIISGHGPTGEEAEPEWRAMAAYAAERGVAEDAILIEPNARNTRDNFRLSAELLERQVGWDSIRSMAIVSRPFHARRALMTARRFFPAHVELVMLSPDDGVQAHDWWRSVYGRFRVLDELRRIGEYALKGDLGDF
jgi:uncharacterized SAM-binding protein YcdF (DUF218 family)